MDISMVSFFAGSLVLITVTLKMLLHITHYTMPIFMALGISMVGYLLVFIGLEVVGLLESGVFSSLHTLPLYYLGLLVIPVGCLLPDYTLAYCLRQYFPTDAQIVQEDQRLARMKQAGGSKNGKNVKGDDDQEAMVEMQATGGRQNRPPGDDEEEEDDENEEEYEEEDEDLQVEEYESVGRGVFDKKQREGRSEQMA